MSDKISVIIAAYNEENNIKKCVESILSQDHENIELIIVNDGSTDGTADALKEYYDYSNVFVHNIENAGVSNARNIGIENSSGNWILFADADDYYCNGAISALVKTAQVTRCEVVQGGLNRSQATNRNDSNEAIVHVFNSSIIAKVLLDYEAELPNEYSMYNRNMRLSTHGPYGKLIKKDIIDDNDIYFNVDMGLGEDLLFYFKVLNAIDRLAIYENDVYVVQDNPHSATRKFNEKMPEYSVIFTMRIIEYMKENNIYEKYKNNLNFQIYMHIMVAIKSYFLHADNYQSDFQKAKEMKEFIDFDLFSQTLQKE